MKLDYRQAFETADGTLVEPWCEPLDLEQAFARLARRPHCLFLDSAARQPLGRYSFLTADPFNVLTVQADASDALAALQARLAAFQTSTIEGLPPFQGGAAGLLGYELARSLERVPRAEVDEFELPAVAIGFYDVVLAVDHETHRAWIISQGFPEQDRQARRERAAARLAQFRSWLRDDVRDSKGNLASCDPEKDLPPAALAPRIAVGDLPGLVSNFSREDYLAAVRRVVQYIYAGDVFQVNLSQRLLYPARGPASELYLRLRRTNPAPFAGYFDLGPAQIVSASPERFLRLRDRRVETRPIKGTRPRSADERIDRARACELTADEKDRAENVMIVDLLRNDLSRVCQPDSVRVSQLCQLESYRHVHHLVSAVEGTLADGRTALDLVRAAFPGGSVTGAPKVRALEIIAELEPNARGAYCGALGYFGFDGSLDLNLLIRTITCARGWWQFPVGGGIVAQSLPEREYDETWHKAQGLLQAIAP